METSVSSPIDLSQYEWNVRVRQITLDDYDVIVALQRACFTDMTPWSIEQLRSQIATFPEGQICIELDGEVVASSSSLLLDVDVFSEGHSWAAASDNGFIRNHDPDGGALYGIEMMVHPKHRGMKLARRMYDARKALCRERNLGLIFVGGRIPGYATYQNEMTAREYVDRVIEKKIYDPVLTSQLSNGFALKRVIRDYLPSDDESVGFATLLEWTNLDYQPPSHKQHRVARPVRICAVQYQMRSVKDFTEFAHQCEYFIDVASGYRSDFVLLPELLTTQLLSCIDERRPAEAARKLTEFTPQYLDLFSDLSVKYNVNIAAGSHFCLEGDDLYNVGFLFTRQGRIFRQPKLHITPNERRWWGVRPGNKLEVFETDRGRVSLQICYDIEFPELTRLAVTGGADLVLVPFCTDERHGYLRVRYCAQARCIENQIYVAIAGTVGNLPQVENMDIQYAQSAIFTPSDFGFARDGVAAEGTTNAETVVVHDVDLEVLRRARRGGTTTNWLDRRTDLYEVRLINQQP